MEQINFFKEEDLKQTFENQTQIIQTLQHANLEIHKVNERSPLLRGQAEENFQQAQQNLIKISDDLKAVHQALKRIKELNILIKEKKENK